MKVIYKSAWIHIVDRKILSSRSKGKDVYYIPGGKPEGEETAKEAAIREIKEELTIDLIPNKLEEVGVFEAQAHNKDDGVRIIMTCFSGPYEGELQPDSEIEEMTWFTHVDKMKSSPVDQIIFDWLKEQDLID